MPVEVRHSFQTENYARAISLLEPSGEQGDADAQFLLGYLYFTNANVERPWAEGWLVKAASQNHPEACYYLSHDTWGRGGRERTENERELLERAAQLGSVQAQYALGVLYATGEGFAKDESKSRLWFGRAAEQGDEEAAYNLAMMLLRTERPHDESGALALLIQAASAGSRLAARFLVTLYEGAPQFGIPAQPDEANKWKRQEENLARRPGRAHPLWFD